MGLLITREVWAHGASFAKGNEMLVLLRLADSAHNETRMTCLSVERICKDTGLSRATVHRYLTALHDKGILQKVARKAIPPNFQRYASVTRRITDVTLWGSDDVLPDYFGPIPADGIGGLDEVDGVRSPKSNPEDRSLNLRHPEAAEQDHSLNLRHYPKNPNLPSEDQGSKPSCKTSSYPDTASPRPAGKARRARKVEPEEDLDPRRYQDSDQDLDVTPGPQGRIAPTTPKQRKGDPDKPMGLAWYFRDAVERTDEHLGLDVANTRIMASHFKRWLARGASPDMVRAMIDMYVEVPGIRRPGTIPWRDFLNRQHLLADRINADVFSAHSWTQETTPAENGRPEPSESFDEDSYVPPFG